ncbi:MAG: hypothetical protein J7L69_09230 [Desulfobulbaceae bacterium]|nr:hypothetical protein [Desulfobulbaceae bacterium]
MMDVSKIKNHIIKHLENIDLCFLKSALQFVFEQHQDEQELLHNLESYNSPDQEIFLQEAKQQVEKNKTWTERVTGRIAELEMAT